MIDDGTPHRIFRISELTREIASHLLLISQGSAVNLGCVCRYLEEPALSTLWETQSSLYPLLEVLPKDTWERWGGLGVAHHVIVVCNPKSHRRNQSLKFGFFSLGSRAILRQRLGGESSATPFGCAEFMWMTIRYSGRTPSANCA